MRQKRCPSCIEEFLDLSDVRRFIRPELLQGFADVAPIIRQAEAGGWWAAECVNRFGGPAIVPRDVRRRWTSMINKLFAARFPSVNIRGGQCRRQVMRRPRKRVSLAKRGDPEPWWGSSLAHRRATFARFRTLWPNDRPIAGNGGLQE